MKLGIQIGGASGCAFMAEGKIVYAASEERFSNKKNDPGFPHQAIAAGMSYLGIAPSDIEEVIFASEGGYPPHYLLRRETSFSVDDYLREQRDYFYPRMYLGENRDYVQVFRDKLDVDGPDAALYESLQNPGARTPVDIWKEWRLNEAVRLFGISRDRVHFVNHEHAHAAYGYYGSPFRGNDVLIVTFDGFGDLANATVSEVRNGAIHQLATYDQFNVGRIYRYLTLILAMKPGEHEYKVMGLAPYASAYESQRALEVFEKSYQFRGGQIIADPDLKDHYFYYKERLEGCRFDGIAGALQLFTERMVCSLVDYWMQQTGKTRVVLSGGVALNIKANMEIGKLDSVRDIHVVGSGGDESLCIGALYAWEDHNCKGAHLQPLSSLYLGAAPSDSEISAGISKARSNANVEVFENISSMDVAKILADGAIIGRISGRMEFGARALGNRSILADPRSPETIKRINRKIKSRDFWMPFTPSMLDVDATRYLKNPKEFSYPYMSVACHTTSAAHAEIPATLHPADLTARPHVVTPISNPDYYELISCFKQLTGVGALLNTSLNLHGYPMANTPAHGLFVLENSDLDALIIGRHLVTKKDWSSS